MRDIKYVNNMTWYETLKVCMLKHDYEKEQARTARLSPLRRFLSRLKKAHKDPCPGYPAETLASMYVRKYNEAKHFVRRIELAGADSLHAVLRYQVEDMRPVLTVTYYEDGTAYVEKWRFCRNGSIEKLPPSYPISEFAIEGLPQRPAVEELAKLQRRLPELVEELREAVQSTNTAAV